MKFIFYFFIVQKNSIIKNSDNSGISLLRCIEVLNKNRQSKLLDFIKFSIKKFSKFKKRRVVKVKKSLIYKGIILSVNFFIQRENGFFLKFDQIKSIGFQNDKLLGTRLKGNVFKELKLLNYTNKKKSDLIRKIFLKTKFIF